MTDKVDTLTVLTLAGVEFIAVAQGGDTAKAYALLKAQDAFFAMSDFSQDIRNRLKHGPAFTTSDEALEWVRETFNEHLRDRGIDLDQAM